MGLQRVKCLEHQRSMLCGIEREMMNVGSANLQKRSVDRMVLRSFEERKILGRHHTTCNYVLSSRRTP